MQYLRQATTATITLGPFVDSTDGSTPETALTLTVKVAKNGAALAARSDATAIAHDADGNYPVVLNATDTSAIGRLRVAATATGALPVWQDFAVLDEAVYDVLFGTTAPSTHTPAAVWAAAPAGVPLEDIGGAAATATRTELAPELARIDVAISSVAGGGSADWTANEREAIRTILGVPASGTTPDVPSAGALKVIDDLIDTEVAAIKAKTDNLPAAFPANFASLAITAAGLASINLAQVGLTPRALDSVADASLTVGDALVAAIAGAAGKETVIGTAYAIKTPSTGTVIRTFVLDSATTPTARS